VLIAPNASRLATAVEIRAVFVFMVSTPYIYVVRRDADQQCSCCASDPIRRFSMTYMRMPQWAAAAAARLCGPPQVMFRPVNATI
jgi:hypothetical protein